MLARSLLAAALVGSLAATGQAGAAIPATWVGTVRVPVGAQPVRLAVALQDGRALVTMGPGHLGRTAVVLRRGGGRLRFVLPGRPPLAFAGAISDRRLAGTVRQGAVQGSFALRARPMAPADDAKTGVYRRADGSAVGVVATQFGRAVIDYSSGEIRSLHGRGPGRDLVGAGIARQNPISGELRFAGTGLSWRGVGATRVGLRSFEVRFPSAGATLSGTLTLPPGAGPFAAAALVHGSGPMPRENQLVFALYLASRGLATLVYDKRGIGWSSGRYGGDAASPENIDVLARDAEAAARFLAAQPEIDRVRVGLVGVSQAGWIMPLAATREAAVRFLVPLVGPTVTQGESDGWGHGIGMGADTIRTFADVEAEVRAAGPGGVDPLPWIRALSIPALWVWGGNDRHVPTALCVERLAPLAADTARDLDYIVLPRANHGLVDSEHGLSDEVAASPRFATGLFEALDGWLHAHGLV